jgi:hypothetical protein
MDSKKCISLVMRHLGGIDTFNVQKILGVAYLLTLLIFVSSSWQEEFMAVFKQFSSRPHWRAHALLFFGQRRRLIISYGCAQGSICTELIQRLGEHMPSLTRAVALAAEVDCLVALAQCARDFRYCRPRLTRDNVLRIKQGVYRPLSCGERGELWLMQMPLCKLCCC